MDYVISRRQALKLSLVVVSGLATACSADGAIGADGAHPAVTPETGAYPVTISHRHGATTINQPPTRIAVIGIGDADVLLALGVIPALVPVWRGSTDDGIGAWAESALGARQVPALSEATTDFSVEAVAAVRPDLILAVNNAIDATVYQQLSAIAPTVLRAAEHRDWVLPWDEVTTRIGQAVGLPGRAQELVTDVRNRLAGARAAHPEFAGRTATLVIRWPSGQFRVFAPESARFQILSALGFVPPPALSGAFTNGLFQELSTELLERIDADVIVVDNWDRDRERIESNPLFPTLAAVREGRVVKLDAITSDAISMPNPLTIPFALDELVDRLRAIDLPN
ncbi:iron-siderophore ABC transporter substrate-binding protein [Nocardia fluminea]|uniref:iron-siderophore ABC transporter substrate-binding protein n=1 Tax=Nocardia fluminea TaxID=134984 RepID=UPI0033F16EE0